MKHVVIAAFATFALSACTVTPEETEDLMNNPLTAPYEAAFGIPPFGKIENEHFLPAIRATIKSHQAEIDAITANPDAPTFANTVLALENSGRALESANAVFSNLNSADTNDEMQDIAKEISPLLSAHRDNIALNEELFNRLKAVWDQRDNLDLDTEDSMLLEQRFKTFSRNGALLGETEKNRLREINARSSMLSLEFGQNTLAETNDFVLLIDDEKDLAGLPDGLIRSAAKTAEEKGHKGAWAFTLHNPSVLPFLQTADNRELRKKIWTAYVNRANKGNAKDNGENIRELTALRAERAALLGYNSHSEYVLEESMAGSVDRVEDLLEKISKPAFAAARSEAADLQEMIEAEGDTFELQPYDWRYYESKLRSKRYSLNEEEVKPYFSINGVRDGVFTVCRKLYGLEFNLRPDAEVYHPDVDAYEVKNADGSPVGILFIDLHARPSKRGGAWMTSYRKQEKENGERIAPLISIVCNFPAPSGDDPVLLTFDEVTTFFHEFGHALHGLLSDVTYRSLSGTSVYRDFVELPSQVLENWGTAPKIMKMYARHHVTGDSIPDEIIEKLEQSANYGEGFATAEYLASTFLDMAYHNRSEGVTGDISAFEKTVMNEVGLPESIVPRHRSTYFGHIFSGGYSSNYYSYIWSAVLDSDAFEAFVETGDLFNSEKAQLFREHILSKGGTVDPMELYKRFRGAEPTIEPLLKKRGMMEKEDVVKN